VTFCSASLHGNTRMKDFPRPSLLPLLGRFSLPDSPVSARFTDPSGDGFLVEVLTRVVNYQEGAPEWRRMKSPP